MANHSGSEGVVKVNTTTIGEIRSYSISETSDTLESTTMGDTSRTYTPSLTSFSGSMDVFWDEADAGQNALSVGTTATINLYPEGNTAGLSEKYYRGNVIITGKTINASFDGMVEASITFQGTDALLLFTLA
jgi:hypothetical protein